MVQENSSFFFVNHSFDFVLFSFFFSFVFINIFLCYFGCYLLRSYNTIAKDIIFGMLIADAICQNILFVLFPFFCYFLLTFEAHKIMWNVIRTRLMIARSTMAYCIWMKKKKHEFSLAFQEIAIHLVFGNKSRCA